MKISEIIMLILFSVCMGVGQLLFKLTAARQSINSEMTWEVRLYTLLGDWVFLLGVVLYGLMLVYWIWLLTFLPLSRAYPFTLLSIVVAAIGGAIFFQETLSLRFFVGVTIMGVGLVVLSTQ